MRGRSNTEAPHQVADSTDLVDWVVKVLLCDRPPPHLAYEVLSEFGPGGNQVVDGSKRTSPDKWDEVHYVIEVILPTACWRQAEYCSVTLQPDARAMLGMTKLGGFHDGDFCSPPLSDAEREWVELVWLGGPSHK